MVVSVFVCVLNYMLTVLKKGVRKTSKFTQTDPEGIIFVVQQPNNDLMIYNDNN